MLNNYKSTIQITNLLQCMAKTGVPNQHKKNITSIIYINRLHRQFSHASCRKIASLLKDASIHDKEIYEISTDVSNLCEICRRYKEALSIPVAGLSISDTSNETLAMDLKEWVFASSKTWFLHLVDHATRYSASIVIKSIKKKL